MAKFDGDQYPLLLNQFEQLKQSDSVQAYQEEFGKLAHGLLLYNNSYDETYFVTRFVAGLKDDIRRVIVLHRPKDVDTASTLALIQEGELNKIKSKGFIKEYQKTNFKSWTDKPKGNEADPAQQKGQKASNEDKLATLKDFRKKNGLCFKYGDKWSHNHKCPAQVPLHVIEELWDALEMAEQELDSEENPETEDSVMAVGDSQASGGIRRRTMRLCGHIGNFQALILVDSGSVGSFISPQLAEQ